MLRYRLSKLLLLLWKLSTIYIFPIIMFIYIYFINKYFGPFSFNNLDQGVNGQKWGVFFIYIFYLLLWKYFNKTVRYYLRKLEY